jgi:predicted amidohydrolase YtcJ
VQLDLVLNNATIYTMDSARPHATSVGIWRGQIVGFDDDIDPSSAHRVIDLDRATVLPGFVDAHGHLAFQGLGLGAVDLSTAASIEQALGVIDRAAARSDRDWLDVSGYDQRNLGRHLTATELDAVSHGRRICLTHVSGHACVVNSLVIAEVAVGAIGPSDVNIGRDESGTPNGLFTEMAQNLVRSRRPAYTVAELKRAVRRSSELCASQGVTFCAEAGIGAGLIRHSPIELAAYQQLVAAGELRIRVQLMVAGDYLHPLGAAADDRAELGIDLGITTGFGSERLSFGAIKLWLDGGMSARTAALTDPYVGSSTRGDLTPDAEAYRAIAQAAHVAGWQLALHAIGDRAIDLALEFIEQAQSAAPRADARPRIEHCGLVRPDQLERIAAANVVAVIQPDFLREFGDDYAAIMGPERTDWMYRGRSFLDHGIRVAGSSDRPVTAGSPLSAIGFMVHRRSRSGRTIGAGEAITIDEALRAYTIDAAWACGLDTRVGSLEPGKLADLVVLSGDPHQVDASAIADLSVRATVVDGEATYDPDGLIR